MCLMIQANKDTWKRKNPSALRSLQKVSLHWPCPIMCICCKTPPIMALKRSLYPSPPPPVLPLHDLGWHPLDPQSQGETLLLLLLLSLQIRSAGVCIERERGYWGGDDLAMAPIRNLKWILICLATVTLHLGTIWIASMNTFLECQLYRCLSPLWTAFIPMQGCINGKLISRKYQHRSGWQLLETK